MSKIVALKNAVVEALAPLNTQEPGVIVIYDDIADAVRQIGNSKSVHGGVVAVEVIRALVPHRVSTPKPVDENDVRAFSTNNHTRGIIYVNRTSVRASYVGISLAQYHFSDDTTAALFRLNFG